MTRIFCSLAICILLAAGVSAQRPQRPGNPPPNVPPGGPGRMGQPPIGDWIKAHDSNRNEKLEQEELRDAIERTFKEIDANGNGSLELLELQRAPRPRGGMAPMQAAEQPRHNAGPPPENAKRLLPPFFFDEMVESGKTLSRADFEAKIRSVFAEMDKNGDSVVTKEEAAGVIAFKKRDHAPSPPNATFLGAELRFGDKLVTGQPFSAETVVERTRRLFDGSTVTKESRGAIYRDSAGRTRREQPLDTVGGIGIADESTKRVTLIFINDFPGKVQYSLDSNNKIARKSQIWNNRFPLPDIDEPKGSKIESTSTQTIEGVSCEMTRIEREIPIGVIGNDKPLRSITERCFSPELQTIIMSVNNDPIGGNHVFKLKNIRRSEPSADLFSVPSGYKVESVK